MKQVVLSLFTLMLSLTAGAAAGNCLTDTLQADFQAGVANSVDLTTSSGNVLLTYSQGSSGGTVDQQNTNITASGEVFTNTQWTGQTFTAGKSGALSRVDLNFFCVFCSTAPPSIIVSIRAASGGLPTGSDLATSSLAITNFSGAQAWYTANFSSPATVSAGTQYAIAIRASAAYGSGRNLGFSNSATSGSLGNDVYGGGALIFSASSGSSWSVQTYGTSPTSDGGFKTYIGSSTSGGYASAGDLTSALKDSNPAANTTPSWTTLSWTSSLPSNTAIKFQAAASDTSTGPFAFVGPDGTATTYFTASNADLSQFNGHRFLKYKSYLTTNNTASTPILSDATVCYTNTSTIVAADLAITNSDGQTSPAAGASVTYNIQATNSGPNDAPGSTVVDNFPAGLSCTWTCTGTCPASGSGNINTSVNLLNGGHANFVAVCSIPSSATGTLTNTATVSAASGVTDSNTSNNSATDTDTLAIKPDVALTLSDSAGMVKIGSVVDYVMQLTNGGPSDAVVHLTDTLPAQLSSASWVCTSSTGGASCSNKGNGTSMSTTATVPVGGVVTYTYSATVASDDAGDSFTNIAAAQVTNGTDPNGANNSASDTDTIVLFLSGFEGGTLATNVAGSIGSGSVAVQLGVDAGLLNTLGPAPVTVASGTSANGKTLFSLQLMRLGGSVAMRTLTTIDNSAFSDVSAWQVVDLKPGVLGLQWQSATSRGDDGYLRTGPGTQIALTAANNAQENLTQLQVTVENAIPWLVLIAQ